MISLIYENDVSPNRQYQQGDKIIVKNSQVEILNFKNTLVQMKISLERTSSTT